MLIHFVNRFLLNFSVFCCFFMYVCIIHDTFYFVNNSNCYYFYFVYFKFSNIWLKCYEKDWFYTISKNLAVHCSFSCSIIHYPIVGDEPFFIWMAEIIFGADPDPFKYFLQFFCCCRELYPFTDQQAHPRCISDRHLVLDNKKAPYSSPVRQWADAIFWIHILLQKKTNERLLLCFMSHLSIIILSHCKTEKKIFMVSAWLVFGYGWSIFG